MGQKHRLMAFKFPFNPEEPMRNFFLIAHWEAGYDIIEIHAVALRQNKIKKKDCSHREARVDFQMGSSML